MLINQYAHGLAGKAPPRPLPLRSISRFAVFRSSNAIAHRTTNNEQPTVPHRTVHRGAEATGEGREGRRGGSLCCPPSPSLSLSRSLPRLPSFPLPVVPSLDHLPFQFLCRTRSIPKRIQTRNGGNGTRPPRIVPNLSPPLSSSGRGEGEIRWPDSRRRRRRRSTFGLPYPLGWDRNVGHVFRSLATGRYPTVRP